MVLCVYLHMLLKNALVFIYRSAEVSTCEYCKLKKSYLETRTLLLAFLGFRGAGGGAVQGTAAASCRTELAAFLEHLHLALSALLDKKINK